MVRLEQATAQGSCRSARWLTAVTRRTASAAILPHYHHKKAAGCCNFGGARAGSQVFLGLGMWEVDPQGRRSVLRVNLHCIMCILLARIAIMNSRIQQRRKKTPNLQRPVSPCDLSLPSPVESLRETLEPASRPLHPYDHRFELRRASLAVALTLSVRLTPALQRNPPPPGTPSSPTTQQLSLVSQPRLGSVQFFSSCALAGHGTVFGVQKEGFFQTLFRSQGRAHAG